MVAALAREFQARSEGCKSQNGSTQQPTTQSRCRHPEVSWNLYAPIITRCNKTYVYALVTGEKGAARPLFGPKERKREKDWTFGERGAKSGGGRVGKCAAARTHQGGGETVERNRTRFGLAVTFYQRRDALLPTKSKRRPRKIKKRKGRRESLLGTVPSRRRSKKRTSPISSGPLFRMSGVGKHVILRGLLPLVILATLSEAQFRCPEPKGFFPDLEQCDLYYVCVDGQPEEKLCKDGLVFRDDNPKKELCDIPANVPCGDRTLLRKFRTVRSPRLIRSFNYYKRIYLYYYDYHESDKLKDN